MNAGWHSSALYGRDLYFPVSCGERGRTGNPHPRLSPLEIRHGAVSLEMDVPSYPRRLQDAGLSTLPGTAAEILDDEVRATLCPDKLRTPEWLDIVVAAHEVGFRTTATIMFGHMERPRHWARHLLRIRAPQQHTGGITEFVPLPFVSMEAPLYRHDRDRPFARPF